MFPQTDSFQNSSRHQSEPLEPCGECRIDYKVVTLYLSGFPRLHLSCLLNLKGQNPYTETYRGGILGACFEPEKW